MHQNDWKKPPEELTDIIAIKILSNKVEKNEELNNKSFSLNSMAGLLLHWWFIVFVQQLNDWVYWLFKIYVPVSNQFNELTY